MPARLEPNRALNRHQLETIAWQVTPVDYRGGSGSRRSVLMNVSDGTTLVPLSSLTDNELRRYIGPKALEEGGDMRKNGKMRKNHSEEIDDGLSDRADLLDELVRGTAESMEIKNWKDAELTQPVIWEAEKYDWAVLRALADVVRQYPPKNGATADELFHADASFLILMTLRGEGVGIWDGSWDEFYDDTKPVEALLKLHLREFSDGTGGGRLEEAFMDAAVVTTGNPPGGLEPKSIEAQDDAGAARVLCLYIKNDYDLVGAPDSPGKEIENDLLRKLENGSFDFDKSERAWLRLMELGAKKYAQEFASSGNWNQVFTKPTLELGAHYLAESFYDQHGNAAATTGSRELEPNTREREKADETAARELCLFIENDYALVGAPNSQGKSIEKNLLRKLKNGSFNLERSEQAWMYLMETGAKKYAKEFASAGDWSRMFTKPTRELCAHYFAKSFYDEHQLGNR